MFPGNPQALELARRQYLQRMREDLVDPLVRAGMETVDPLRANSLVVFGDFCHLTGTPWSCSNWRSMQTATIAASASQRRRG